MKDFKIQLQKELFAAGANTIEVKELLLIATKLKLMKQQNDASTTDSRQNYIHWSLGIKPLFYTVFGLTLGMFLAGLSTSALPTSWLYPVQNLSDSVVIRFNPAFRANIMMQRAQQVNELITNHAESKQVLATLDAYNKEVSAYMTDSHNNYAAFEYCKTVLIQAGAKATPNVRRAIYNSLNSFLTT